MAMTQQMEVKEILAKLKNILQDALEILDTSTEEADGRKRRE